VIIVTKLVPISGVRSPLWYDLWPWSGSLQSGEPSRQVSFPVGKVSFMDLHPMSFREFLSAMGRPRYASLLDETSLEPLPDAIHTELVDLLRKYYFTGGMPEAVRHFAETSDVAATREIHKSLKSYDEQHAPPVLVRANLLNLKRDGKICNVPLYAVSWLSRRPAAICVWDLDTASSEGEEWTR
jgi:hypothetical protein